MELSAWRVNPIDKEVAQIEQKIYNTVENGMINLAKLDASDLSTLQSYLNSKAINAYELRRAIEDSFLAMDSNIKLQPKVAVLKKDVGASMVIYNPSEFHIRRLPLTLDKRDIISDRVKLDYNSCSPITESIEILQTHFDSTRGARRRVRTNTDIALITTNKETFVMPVLDYAIINAYWNIPPHGTYLEKDTGASELTYSNLNFSLKKNSGIASIVDKKGLKIYLTNAKQSNAIDGQVGHEDRKMSEIFDKCKFISSVTKEKSTNIIEVKKKSTKEWYKPAVYSGYSFDNSYVGRNHKETLVALRLLALRAGIPCGIPDKDFKRCEASIYCKNRPVMYAYDARNSRFAPVCNTCFTENLKTARFSFETRFSPIARDLSFVELGSFRSYEGLKSGLLNKVFSNPKYEVDDNDIKLNKFRLVTANFYTKNILLLNSNILQEPEFMPTLLPGSQSRYLTKNQAVPATVTVNSSFSQYNGLPIFFQVSENEFECKNKKIIISKDENCNLSYQIVSKQQFTEDLSGGQQQTAFFGANQGTDGQPEQNQSQSQRLKENLLYFKKMTVLISRAMELDKVCEGKDIQADKLAECIYIYLLNELTKSLEFDWMPYRFLQAIIIENLKQYIKVAANIQKVFLGAGNDNLQQYIKQYAKGILEK